MLTLALALALSVQDAHAGRHDHHAMGAESAARSTVVADVRTVDEDARTALLRHEAMEELSMPSMVMEFEVAEPVDFTLFRPGAALIVTVENRGGVLTVVEARPEDAHAGH
ncbi:copper-binding protein [Marinicauda algicola]|uniref:Copper-binding protein n=1 Tax=Marinicauda algicola TaxID=2029849 RepID=A0A4S2GXN5_9PROT|nr:copper-binding protein [Marinicauda algicola]TGY87621.1 copper-binding protein [Marinicauda algicola]